MNVILIFKKYILYLFLYLNILAYLNLITCLKYNAKKIIYTTNHK
jgi:hypothetical protein